MLCAAFCPRCQSIRVDSGQLSNCATVVSGAFALVVFGVWRSKLGERVHYRYLMAHHAVTGHRRLYVVDCAECRELLRHRSVSVRWKARLQGGSWIELVLLERCR